jgi:hypothetical protein
MTTAKWTINNTREQQDLYYLAARFNEKGCLWVWGWRCSYSTGAPQYITLPKYFSHPSLVIYFFGTPPIKPKLGQQIVGGLLIANHLDQSL